MHAAKTLTFPVPHPAGEVFRGVKALADQAPWSLVEVDETGQRVAFTRGKSAFSWGHEYIAEVLPQGEECELTLTVGGFDDKPKSLMDGAKNKKAAKEFVAALQQALGD